MPTRFQNVQEACDIALDVGIRVLDRITHPGLRRQIDRRIEPLGFEQGVDKGLVRQVGPDETVAGQYGTRRKRVFRERLRPRNPRLRQTGMLQPHGIIVVDIVETHHLVAPFRQPADGMVPDKSGSAGNQYFHRSSFLWMTPKA